MIGKLISPHIVAADVGQNRFENPSPNWNANTAVCLVSPIASANGAIIGIDVAACPDPDGIKKFIIFWTTTIPTAAIDFGRVDKVAAILFIIVSIICPSSITIVKALATPTAKAPNNTSEVEVIKCWDIWLKLYPPINPVINIIIKNKVDNSFKYQP